jgi:arabinofuranosyltransferase
VPTVVLAALALHAWTCLPFLSDDALISLRYARRLLDGQGLGWTDGERVEGYSNLLWVLLCALLGAFGIDLVTASRILGLLGMASAALAVVYAAGRSRAGAAAGGLCIAAAAPVAAWAVGGLEQPLLAGLLAWAVVRTWPLLDGALRHRDLAVPAGLLALLCWTRPDGQLLVASLAAGVVLARRGGGRAYLAIGLVAPAAIAVLLQLAFRVVYYGDWVPNTAHVKLAFTPERLVSGWTYLCDGLVSLLPLLLLAGLAVRAPARTRRIVVVVPVLVAWSAYVVGIGGDIFPAWRHLVPVVVLLALLAAEAVASLPRRLGWGAAVAVPLLLLWTSERDSEAVRAHRERWEWDGEVIGRLFAVAFGEARPLLAVEAAGCLPYFSNLPSLDLLGLNDRYLARKGSDQLGRGRIGHELGDAQYVLERRPDLMILHAVEGSPRLTGPTGSGLREDRRFRQWYQLVRFRGTEPHRVSSYVWVLRDSPKIGIRREPGRIVVPGMFLSDGERLEARLDGDRKLGVLLLEGDVAVVRLPLPAGEWSVTAEASGDPVTVAVSRPRPRASTADVSVRTTGRSHVRSLTLVQR